MQLLTAHETAALLPYPALATALRAILPPERTGAPVAPPRTTLGLPGDGILLLMPAVGGGIGMVKLVTVHPANAAQGRPSVQGDVLVFDAATGERLCLLDGATVTARRTAALSLLAAQLLAPEPDGPLLIVGAGVQGRAHLEAFGATATGREVMIASRTAAHAEALAAYGRQLGIAAQAVRSPLEAVARATLIIAATTSATPVVPEQVRDDAFIAAVGAYRPEMAEVPPALVRRSQVVVDTLAGAQHEAGDLLQAGVDWSGVQELRSDLARPDHGPVLFKSVGHALWDLAAAQLAQRQRGAPPHPPGALR